MKIPSFTWYNQPFQFRGEIVGTMVTFPCLYASQQDVNKRSRRTFMAQMKEDMYNFIFWKAHKYMECWNSWILRRYRIRQVWIEFFEKEKKNMNNTI